MDRPSPASRETNALPFSRYHQKTSNTNSAGATAKSNHAQRLQTPTPHPTSSYRRFACTPPSALSFHLCRPMKASRRAGQCWNRCACSVSSHCASGVKANLRSTSPCTVSHRSCEPSADGSHPPHQPSSYRRFCFPATLQGSSWVVFRLRPAAGG